MPYSNIELTDMVLVYGAAGENARRAQILYRERFPNRNVPNARTFVSVVQHLRDDGTYKGHDHERGRFRTARVLNAEPRILESVEENPGTSTRMVANQIGVSQSIVWRTLHEQGLHPYHVQKVQALYAGDEVHRMAFCRWLLQKYNDDPDFLNIVLFTDEAGFTRTDGVLNMHNTHVWSDENPHAIREHRHQRMFSINVWAGIIDNQLIGPYVLPNRLTGQRYLHFISEIMPDLLDDVNLDILRRMWYLHDGAPPHYARQVAQYLNQNFPDRWIGRNGPIHWPARSPDLNPCDFYLWGHMKHIVYSEPINSVEELTQRVNMAAVQIRGNPGIFDRVRNSLRRRDISCLENDGSHFEHLL